MGARFGSFVIEQPDMSNTYHNYRFIALLSPSMTWLAASQIATSFDSIPIDCFGCYSNQYHGYYSIEEMEFVDDATAIIMAGYFSGKVQIGHITLESMLSSYSSRNHPSTDMFVAKLNIEGELLWVKHASGSGGEYLYELDILKDGSISIFGYSSSSTMYLNDDEFQLVELESNMFWVKLSSNGQWIMATSLEQGPNYHIHRTTILDDNSLVIVGTLYGGLYGGNSGHTLGTSITLTCESQYCMYIARMLPNGKYAMASIIAETLDLPGYWSYMFASSMESTLDGGVVVSGSFQGRIRLGSNLELISTCSQYNNNNNGCNWYSQDYFIVKITTQGKVLWALTATSQEYLWDSPALGVSSDGSVMIAGNFRGSINFGSIQLKSSGSGYNSNGFVAKIASDNGSFISNTDVPSSTPTSIPTNIPTQMPTLSQNPTGIPTLNPTEADTDIGQLIGVCLPGSYRNYDDSCKECPAGQYSNISMGIEICELCPAGRFSPRSGRASIDSCLYCPIGTYQMRLGSTQCEICDPGTYSNTEGSLYCQMCAPGHVSYSGYPNCEPCPMGSYNPGGGGHQCLPCAPGSYSKNEGSARCIPCPDGMKQPVAGSISCYTCDANKEEL